MREIYDAIIIGCGIAGLSAAIHLKEKGLNVLMITKTDEVEESNTYYAQGGIIAWKEGDSPKTLEDDLLTAGCFYNNKEAVKMLAEEGPQLVFDILIDKLGIEFSKKENGDVHYTGEAAHSQRRIVHYKDHTGDKIQSNMLEYARKLEIPLLASHTAVDLITNNHHSTDYQELYRPREVMGVYVLNNKSEEIETLFAHTVIMATGGLGNLYQYTTNPHCATGDGMSMAYRAGADIINAEFVQFHPTNLFHKDVKRFLISESLRGEGAKLLNHKGKLFMKNYTHLEELAPRDVVARAIYEEMSREGKEYMYLDIAHYYKDNQDIKDRFSKIYETCMNCGIDITREPIPIVPAAHYFCGGIKVDKKGRSSLKNLYAIGEVSCSGVHGANRLASSSLLEGVLWGVKCAEDIEKSLKKISIKRFKLIPDWESPSYSEDFDTLLLKQDLKAIQLTMWNYAGIVRTKRGLERAKADLNYFSHRIFKFYQEAKINRNIIELRNAVVSASIIVNAATHNNKSIGCHHIKNS